MSSTTVTEHGVADDDAPDLEQEGPAHAWPVARASLAAAADGALAAVWVLALLSVVALTGWFSADAGLRWEPRTALRVAADAWALGQGAWLVQPWGVVSVVPLGVTVLSVLAARRAGRRVAARAESDVSDSDVAVAGALVLGGYLVATLVVVVLAGAEESGPSLLRALAGSTLVVAVGAFPTLVAGTDRGEAYVRGLRRVVPAWVIGAAARAGAVLALHLAVSSMLLGALLLRHADAGAASVSSLQPSALDAVVLAAASLLVLPVLVIWTASWLVGPGVAVGAGTLVTPTSVTLGPLPAVPFTAALPAEQPDAWLAVVQVTPVLVGLCAVLLLRRTRPVAWPVALAQAAMAGVLAALGLALLGAAASGSVGPGRLAEVGVPVVQLGLTSAAAFGLGAVLGATVLMVLDSRRARGRDEDDEPTIEIIVETRGERAFTPAGWRRVTTAADRPGSGTGDAEATRGGR